MTSDTHPWWVHGVKRGAPLLAGSTCGDGDQEWDALSSLLQRWAADPQSLMPRRLHSDGSASFSTTRDVDAGAPALTEHLRCIQSAKMWEQTW